MQKLREVAHRIERAIGDLPDLAQRLLGLGRVLQPSLRHCQLHFDGRQRLAHLVVQLPGNRPPLLLLGVDQLGGEPLEVLGVLEVAKPLLPDALLETARVAGDEHRDGNGQKQRDAAETH